MAHHVGELIAACDDAEGDPASPARQTAAAAIIELWKHRALMPASTRPMSSFEPVLRALARLGDPQRQGQFYGYFKSGDAPAGANPETFPLLRVALLLEDRIRDVVADIVVLAAVDAADDAEKWTELAAGLIDDPQHEAVEAVLRFCRQAVPTEGAPQAEAPLPDADTTRSRVIETLGRASDVIALVRSVVEDGSQTGESGASPAAGTPAPRDRGKAAVRAPQNRQTS